jgi:hypothetical protein
MEEIARFIARDARGNPFFLVVYHAPDMSTDAAMPLIKTLDGSIVERLGQGIYQIPDFDAVYVTSDDPQAP